MKKITLIVSAAFLTYFIAFPSLTKAADMTKGVAKITGTSPGSKVFGIAALTQMPEGLQVDVTFENAPPGEHAFHIHEVGNCGDMGKAAGGHYNPLSAPHGFLPRDGAMHAHAGDMGNIMIDENGRGTLKIMLPGITLKGGKYDVAGRAIVLHEKLDDFGQPTGNAGGRIGCGIIEVTDNK